MERDDKSRAELRARVEAEMERSGEVERLMNVLKSRLMESGWKEELKLACMKIVQERGAQNIDTDTLVAEVTPVARAKVPDAIKKELLQMINISVRKQFKAIEMERVGQTPSVEPQPQVAQGQGSVQRGWRQ